MTNQTTQMPISGTTKLFGCIAHPTDHVRAPSLFNPQFSQKGQDAVMVPVDIAPDNIKAGIDGLRAMPNFIGAAVTIPHKMTIAALCDELGPVAKITGAVNAIRFIDGKLYGDNFDGAGFVAGLYGQGHDLRGKKCLIIGAGGAARAIAYALSCEEIGGLTVYNRTKDKAADLVKAVKMQKPEAMIAVAESLEVSSFDIVINATALGLKEDDPLPCDISSLSKEALLCDIIMVPAETKLLKAAAKQGITCHYGRHMLDYQIALISAFIGADDI
ncbi:MAG: shikimate dehydrogenase family protein [Candidatus Puniceispirillaceae bacterium]